MIVSCTFFVFQQCVGQARKVHETTTFLLVTLPNIHRFKNSLTILVIDNDSTVKQNSRIQQNIDERGSTLPDSLHALQYPTIYARSNRYKNSFVLLRLNRMQ